MNASGATSIFSGIKDKVEAAGGKANLSVSGEYVKKPDVAIVVFGENPAPPSMTRVVFLPNAKAFFYINKDGDIILLQADVLYG